MVFTVRKALLPLQLVLEVFISVFFSEIGNYSPHRSYVSPELDRTIRYTLQLLMAYNTTSIQ